jgi:prevent-host-death family protein
MKISLKQDINSLSYFKSNFNKILKELEKHHRPLILTQNGKSTGVFLDIEAWENLLKKIQVLKLINEGENSFSNDNGKTIEETEQYFKEKYEI